METIINQTKEYYLKNNICLIHKKNLDVTFRSVDLNDKKLKLNEARIKTKSSVDYYGVYQGKFLAFEAKSTEEDFLPINNIKNHQIEYLNIVEKYKGISFWIIFFKNPGNFIFIKHKDFVQILKNKKAIHYKDALTIGKKLILSFPGILNIVENIIF